MFKRLSAEEMLASTPNALQAYLKELAVIEAAEKDTASFSNPSAAQVPGYKPQSEANLKIVKFHKEWEERTMRHLDWLKAQDGIDQRWLAMGRTSLENGFMQVNRAVMQPGRVALPEDANPKTLAYNQKPYVPTAWEKPSPTPKGAVGPSI